MVLILLHNFEGPGRMPRSSNWVSPSPGSPDWHHSEWMFTISAPSMAVNNSINIGL